MGIPVIERTEARTENDVAIVCEHQDRAPDRKPFVIARQNLEVPVDLRILELEDLNELIDLRNVLNEMIDNVQSDG